MSPYKRRTKPSEANLMVCAKVGNYCCVLRINRVRILCKGKSLSIVTVGLGAIDAPDSGIEFRVGSNEITAGVLHIFAVINVQIEGIGCSLKRFGLAAYRIGPPAPAVISEAVGHNHPHIAEKSRDAPRSRTHPRIAR